LAGKIAGVSVTQSSGAAGAGAVMIIRGGTSLERDNGPLFVVDGVIYDNSTVVGGNSGFDGVQAVSTTTSNRVMDINPEDIESLSVLKGPSAAALYGANAANGAVVITTKKGKAGRVQVNFGSKITVSNVNRYPSMQNTYKRGFYNVSGDLIEDETSRGLSWGEKFTAGETKYNNVEDFFETSLVYDNSVNISGGSENSNVYLSISDYRQGGIIPATAFDKTTFRLNAEQKYGKLTVGANIAYSIAKSDKSFTSSGLYGINASSGGAMTSVYRWTISDDMSNWLNPDGTQYRQFANEVQLQNDFNNPYWVAYKNKIFETVNRFTGSLKLNFDITNWWNFSYTAGIDRYTNESSNFTAPGTAGISILYKEGLKSENTRTYEYLSSNFMTNFHKTFFNDLNVNLMLGNAVEDTKIKTNRIMYWGFVAPNLYSVANTGINDRRMSQGNSRKRLVGMFGELSIDYKGIAYLSVTGRNDWSSTLPVENRSYFFPSASGSFVFTELIEKNNILSFGKLRLSVSQVGRDASPYLTNTYLDSPEYSTTGLQMVSNQWTRGNPYLKPEMTTSWEIGTELRFLDGRLNFDWAFYNQTTEDIIMTPRLSQATGYILLSVNAGKLRNQGMEIQISGTPVKNRDFRWDAALNISGNRGEILELVQGTNELYITDVQIGNAKAGSFNPGAFMGITGGSWMYYEYDPNNANRNDKSLDGKLILTNDSQLGAYVPQLKDANQNWHKGNREPKFIGGFNNTLTYKNLSLNVLFEFRVGGDIYDGTDYYMTQYGLSKNTEKRESITVSGLVADASQPSGFKEVTNDITTPYGIYKYYTTYHIMEALNFIQKDINWLRLRSVSLTYTAPESWLKKLKVIKKLSATVSANNLFLITNYKGMDPETSAAGSGIMGSTSIGMDYCGVPSTRGFTFGLNVTF
jgi:TonB-linked SusC/RagA family outer membrane protein